VILVLALALASEAEFRRAVEALERGDLPAAARGFEAVVQAEPLNAGALANLGVVYSRMDRPADAIGVYRRALKLAPDEPMLLLNLGLAHFKQGSCQSAKPLLARVPTDQARLLHAACELNLGEPDKALALVNTLPPSAERSSVAGAALLRLGKKEEARAAFEDVFARIPAAQANLLAGRAYLDAALFDEAISAFREAGPEGKTGLARCYLGLRRNTEAEAELRAALKLRPSDPDASYYLGALLALEHRASEALPYLETARAARPDGWGAYYYLGRAYYDLKNYSLALANLDRAAKANPGEAATYFQLARVYSAAQRPGDARTARARFVELKDKSLESSGQVLAPVR
jgi:tetratricopeptide (TPR) repeat protein